MRYGCFWLNDRVKWPDDLVLWGMSVSHPRRGQHPIVPHDSRSGNPLFERMPISLHTLIINYDRIKITVNDKENYLPPGSVCIWDQSQKVLYGERGVEWRLGYLQISGEKFESWLKELKLKVNTPLNWLDTATVEHYLGKILYECQHYIKPSVSIMENQLYGFFLELKRANKTRTAKQPKIPIKIQHIKNYLDINYQDPISLSQMADDFEISSAYLSRKFKSCYHMSPMDYLIDLRLRYATNLLLETNDKIGEISRQVGFTDVFHFSKIFKKRLGCSPKAYRQKNKLDA